jgi:hypothetical protein
MKKIKIFLDNIHPIYHQSNKNWAELYKIPDLEAEVIKMGCVLSLGWAACSLKAATAVLNG